MNVFVAVLKRLDHVTYESFWFEIQTKLLRSMAANNFAHFDRLPMLNHNSGNVDQAKLDKKRERNRIAASKCRQRKLEKIQTLGKIIKVKYCSWFCKYESLIGLIDPSILLLQRSKFIGWRKRMMSLGEVTKNYVKVWKKPVLNLTTTSGMVVQ